MDDQEISLKAANYARAKTLASLKRQGVTSGLVAKRLKEALNAEEIRVFNDKDVGIVYSEPLVAHQARLKAIEIASVLLEMKPSEKHDVNLKGDLGLLLQEIDGTTLDLPSQRKKGAKK